MIYVAHHEEWPRKLKEKFDNCLLSTNGEARSAWSSFKGKNDLISNLKYIQKGLCAYCEIKIKNSSIDCHLEHIKPKSLYIDKTFDYKNIVLSCFSSQNLEKRDSSISCGHKKANEFDEDLFISPTDSKCNDFFEYDLFGKIKPKDNLSEIKKKRAKYTINLLNLNSHRLVRKRNEIIEQGYEIIQDLQSDAEALKNFLSLELEIVNNQYAFSFINLRKQYFSMITF